MAKFEIFIPAHDASSFNMTLRVTADTWMAALKLGLAKLQLPIVISDVVVDVREDHSVHVTEPSSGRVFRISEVQEAATTLPPLVAPATGPLPPPPPIAPAAPPLNESFLKQAMNESRALPGPPPEAKKPEPKKPEPKKAEAKKPEPARTETPPPPVRPRDEAQEERLATAFHRVSEIVIRARNPADAANLFLDLALEIVPAEAAAVFYAHLHEQDLHVAAARGPSAAYALVQRVPMGLGIVGAAVDSGVTIAVSHVQNDPRYSTEVPESLGVRPESIVSAPVHKDGRSFGALHLVNSRGGTFSQDEAEVLGYLAQRLAEYLDRYFAVAA